MSSHGGAWRTGTEISDRRTISVAATGCSSPGEQSRHCRARSTNRPDKALPGVDESPSGPAGWYWP